MIFSKLSLICMFKDKSLAEKCTNLAENLKKLGSAEPVESDFYSSGPRGPNIMSTFMPVAGQWEGLGRQPKCC